MSQTVKRQRDRVDGNDVYDIEFRREDSGAYSILCHEHPNNPHGGNVNETHLYGSGRVCVTAGREPRTLDRAIAIAHVFMKNFSHHARTGQAGRNGGRVNV